MNFGSMSEYFKIRSSYRSSSSRIAVVPNESSPYFARFLRTIFHRSAKINHSTLKKSVTDISTVLVENNPIVPACTGINNNEQKDDICLFSESPHYVVRVC